MRRGEWCQCKRKDFSGSFPVQAPVLNRVGEVLFKDIVAVLKIGDGAGYLEGPVVGAVGTGTPSYLPFAQPCLIARRCKWIRRHQALRSNRALSLMYQHQNRQNMIYYIKMPLLR